MKRQKVLGMRWLLGMMALALLLGGCAAGTAGGPTQASASSSMEQLLVQAGFRIFPENSPKCEAVCRKLPPEQLVPQKKGDKIAYSYYAPGTHLLYIGDEAAYQNFINLAVIQNLEPRRRAVMETVPDDPEFWTLWSSSQGGG
jgi:hypothetical protein